MYQVFQEQESSDKKQCTQSLDYNTCYQKYIDWYIPKMRNDIALTVIKKYFPNGIRPTAADITCVGTRQLEHPLGDVIAVDKRKCRHGFTRAIVRFPVHGQAAAVAHPTAHSGMIRLTCPHLVKEIDSLEVGGGIRKVNDSLSTSATLKDDFNTTNESWAAARKSATTDAEVEFVKRKMGAQGAKHFFDSGIIGVSKGKTDDAKCLHAHVADFIIRGKNEIGQLVLDELQKKNVNTEGCSGMWQVCVID